MGVNMGISMFKQYPCSDKSMLMYMRFYNLYAVHPLNIALNMCDYLILSVFGGPTPRSSSD